MRSNSNRIAAEKYWKHTLEVLEDNLILMLTVLREEYGFGEKRLISTINAVRAKAKIFEEMSEDEVLKIKTEDIRIAYHETFREILRINAKELMPPEIYTYFFETDIATLSEVRRNIHTRDKIKAQNKKISMKEAARLQSFMQAAQGYLKDEGYKISQSDNEVISK